MKTSRSNKQTIAYSFQRISRAGSNYEAAGAVVCVCARVLIRAQYLVVPVQLGKPVCHWQTYAHAFHSHFTLCLRATCLYGTQDKPHVFTCERDEPNSMQCIGSIESEDVCN